METCFILCFGLNPKCIIYKENVGVDEILAPKESTNGFNGLEVPETN